MKTLRVLLADDHPAVRAGVRALLAQSPGIAVAGEAGDGVEALRLMRSLAPDLVLMDIAMPGLNGLETLRRAVRLRPAPRVIVLSMHAVEGYVREALAAGARGYVLKSAGIEELERAIRIVARGGHYVSAALADLAAGPAGGQVALTSRQREVLQLIAEGLSSRAIAARLHLSLKTVETHRAAIQRRLGIRDVASLTRYAMRMGLIAPGT